MVAHEAAGQTFFCPGVGILFVHKSGVVKMSNIHK
jgi:hypothetical protein